MTALRSPVVSTLGIVSRDELLVLDQFPAEGSFTTVRDHLVSPGGTTGNIATALAKLGAQVRLFSRVGSDDWGRSVVETIAAHGVDTSGVLIADGRTDRSVILVSAESGERTILWERGPTLERGDRLDIDRLFRADLTVIDSPDYELCRFLTDLPAHTWPHARLLGTLSYLADVNSCDRVEVACRFDVLVGTEREYCALTGDSSPGTAFDSIVRRTTGSNLRTAVMTRGNRGAVGATASARFDVDALSTTVVDTTGAGDAFVAGLSYALSVRWPLGPSLKLGNAVASYAVSALGAQTALPSFVDALARANIDPDFARDIED
jgi:sugar/nucleoside kinase (ribokinase family)